MKILTVVGARPQFIKAAVLSRAISKHNGKSGDKIRELIVHTGQHYDENMSDIFFEEMKIPSPDYNLGVGGKNHGAMTGQMIERLEEIYLSEKPDWIVVYGDTNSTLAASVVASKTNVKLAHVEAGLRSFNMNMPEEVNRILTDRVSDVLFCPTDTAVENLRNEAFPFITSSGEMQRIKNIGDVMYDGAMYYKDFAKKPESINGFFDGEASFVLCTVHRAENTDSIDKLKSILKALSEISDQIPVILPLHPRTKNILDKIGFKPTQGMKIIDPVSYLEMIWLLKNCSLVMTDSGGLQKEAYFFQRQCVTLRDETEWVELVKYGANVLVGSDYSEIMKVFETSTSKSREVFNQGLYGDGTAGEKIINELLK